MGAYLRPAALRGGSARSRAGAPAARDRGWSWRARPTTTRRASGRLPDEDVLDVTAIGGLRGTSREIHGGWWIGALTTWTDLVETPLPPLFDGLKRPRSPIGGLQIQARGDDRRQRLQRVARPPTACPNLLALDAEVELGVRARRAARADRRVRRSATGAPRGSPTSWSRASFVPAPLPGTTGSVDVREARLAGLPRDLDRDGRRGRRGRRRRADRARPRRGRCLLGGRAAAARRSRRRSRAGAATRRDRRARARRSTSRSSSPIDDVRGTAAYRRDAALDRVRRALERALAATCLREHRRAHDRRSSSTVNGSATRSTSTRCGRLSDVLRDDLGLTGTKVGCEAGDCGACTVRLDGRQAVLVPRPGGARPPAREITTVEGLAGADGSPSDLQAAFLAHGAAQCGICTPGMLMAADTLLRREPRRRRRGDPRRHRRRAVPLHRLREDRRGDRGDAGRAARRPRERRERRPLAPRRGADRPGAAVGARIAKVDGLPRVLGTARYGADHRPEGVARASAPSARRTRGRDSRSAISGRCALATRGSSTSSPPPTCPARTATASTPTGKDQPALADGMVRHRGEAVLALVGDERTIARDRRPRGARSPGTRSSRSADLDAGPRRRRPAAPRPRQGNVLIRGRLATRRRRCRARRHRP